MNYEPYIDKLMQHFTGQKFMPEVEAAKEDFFERAGTFDEASLDFELKMAQFTDWYLFTRKMEQSGQAGIEMVLDDASYNLIDDERPLYLNLRNSRHSLFEFIKLKGDDVYIKDLFTGFKYVIRQSRLTQGFNRDEYFEARLIPHDGSFVFSNSFCFHPAVVSKFVLKEVKRVNKLPEEEQAQAREELIARLFKMKHKHGQYKHLDIHEIYSNESKLRL
ncbi:MAG TPA: hypothetical protein PKC28_10785 [Bdellovibrionales bacterium]|nr:hypothetical protein [Bdellovibrionales bacterium]